MTCKKPTDNEIANEYKMFTPEECLQKIVDQHKEINRLQVRVEKCEKVATLNGTKFDGMFASVTHLEAIPEFDMQSDSSTDKTIATLQAENDLLQETNKQLKSSIDFVKVNDIATLQAENERLKNILICFMEALGKVRNVDDIDSISLIPLMSELNKGIRAEIKAEAYKELLNFLEARLVCKSKISSIGYESAIIDIKNHLKELEGD